MFKVALQLEEPWKLTHIEYDDKEEAWHLFIDFEKGSTFACPNCGVHLKEKQLNRITDRINKELQWEGDKRITPHGFRSSLSTLLSERGVDKVAIKIVIGHSDEALDIQENVWIYIRRHKRYINLIRKELTAMEQQLEGPRGSISEPFAQPTKAENHGEHIQETTESYDETMLIELLKTHPKLAMEIIKKGL